ncbi:hypothetical protein M404DRAFT_753423 [Pisolithus tinctorius Marx 270]|uniref:Uncharacterized protein n=1 Tax=Pisolithus tinctorius Marx 270 TaxID=870435 RepID=A0A0C3JTR7_PISTI|nr:hypothetical protein M404DRAFT_753423 [Pisolithus tinctorius Marx 270]
MPPASIPSHPSACLFGIYKLTVLTAYNDFSQTAIAYCERSLESSDIPWHEPYPGDVLVPLQPLIIYSSFFISCAISSQFW